MLKNGISIIYSRICNRGFGLLYSFKYKIIKKNKKQEIIYLYYEKGLIQTEIADNLDVSKAYITKIIK